MQRQKESIYNSEQLCRLLFENKKPIIIILAFAAVMALVFSSSLFITPLYKSTTILYPTSSNSISKVLLSTTFSTDKDIMNFGETEQTEQMLQVLNSNKIREKVIDRFNLMEHYDINPNQKYPYTKLNKIYNNRISFRKTENNAVKITVFDKDPEIASQMANDIAEIYDSTMNQIQKEVAVKAFLAVEKEYKSLCQEMEMLEDSLNTLRKLGVFDYNSQIEMLSQQMAIELGRNNTAGIKAIQKQLDILAQYGGASFAINERLSNDRLQLSLIKAKYEEAKIDATESIPHKFVVSTAFTAEKTAYPVKWLIVTLTICSTFVFLMLLIIILDRFGLSIKRNEKRKGGQ